MRRILGASRHFEKTNRSIPDVKVANVTPGASRDDGDRARDEKDWNLAERHYVLHLSNHPDDVPIWIQLGHCLKEQGKLSEAEHAYRHGIELSLNDADAYLQLGHVLKLQYKRNAAAQAYIQSMRLQPTQAAYQETSSLIGVAKANQLMDSLQAAEVDTKLIYIEIDDLLGWLRAHRTLSGIQRVQVGIIRAILNNLTSNKDSEVQFVRSRSDTGTYWKIWNDDLREIVNYSISDAIEMSEQLRLLERAEQSAVKVIPQKGQCYFVLGAFWGFNNDASRYAKLKHAGVSVGVYIYDLIPVTHPEYCDAHLVSDFALSLGDGLALFDFIVTISEFTAQEVRRLQKKLDLKITPVEAVLLAHVLNDEPTAHDASDWTANITELQGRRFVLSVSTIEARKNHAYLFAAWRLMLEEGLDPPDLVFIGRYGWRVTDFMEQMRATNFLNGRLHVLHDLSDSELETLYRNCEFTLFPSYVEGWGLPVGESLAHGRPCIASKTSSIPEVGGELVDYVDPYDVRSGVEAIRKMAFDTTYRKEREKDIQDNFVARTWPLVTDQLLETIDRLRPEHVSIDTAPLFHPGEIFYPADLRLGQIVPPNYPSRPLRLMLAEAWYAPEAVGVWMRGTCGSIAFQTGLGANKSITLYFKLIGAPWGTEQTVSIVVNAPVDLDVPTHQQFSAQSVEYPRRIIKGRHQKRIVARAFLLHVNATTDHLGRVACRVYVFGKTPPLPEQELRTFSLGLSALAYTERADAELGDELEGVLGPR